MESEPIEITDPVADEEEPGASARKLTVAFGVTLDDVTLTEYINETYRQVRLSGDELVRAFATWYGEKTGAMIEDSNSLDKQAS